MAKPQTIIRDGSGAQSASYSLPPGVFQYVESVLVQVDNTAGPDVRPTLSVATVNGVVMAAKRQGEAIPAGDEGVVTWALRLTDEARAGGGAFGPELDYVERTVDLTITAATLATANVFLTSNSVALDGATRIWVECGCAVFDFAVNCVINLFDNDVDQGRFAQGGAILPPGAFNVSEPLDQGTFLTPPAGSHVFELRCWSPGSPGNAHMNCAPPFRLSWLRIVQAN